MMTKPMMMITMILTMIMNHDDIKSDDNHGIHDYNNHDDDYDNPLE